MNLLARIVTAFLIVSFPLSNAEAQIPAGLTIGLGFNTTGAGYSAQATATSQDPQSDDQFFSWWRLRLNMSYEGNTQTQPPGPYVNDIFDGNLDLGFFGSSTYAPLSVSATGNFPSWLGAGWYCVQTQLEIRWEAEEPGAPWHAYWGPALCEHIAQGGGSPPLATPYLWMELDGCYDAPMQGYPRYGLFEMTWSYDAATDYIKMNDFDAEVAQLVPWEQPQYGLYFEHHSVTLQACNESECSAPSNGIAFGCN